MKGYDNKMVKVELKNVSFSRDGKKILSDINLTIEDQEYLTIVGPTGAGKSSLIATIAGLYTPTSGKVYFDGKDITKKPANERNCGFMFESYALFPHLSVMDNVCYAQYMKEEGKEDTKYLGNALLELVKLSNRGLAFPGECSGGMKQRVALARALMALEEGGILVIDEPFKALDAGLRLNLRREVHKIAKNEKLRLTTIHVTNDMEEAMMGDKIVILNEGNIVQIGTPNKIMYSPKERFVAEFFSTELNEFKGEVKRVDEIEDDFYLRKKQETLKKLEIETEEGNFLYAKTNMKYNGREFHKGDRVQFLIRPQYYKARHGHRKDKPNSLLGKVLKAKFMGSWLRMEVLLKEEDKVVRAEVPTTRVAEHNFETGEDITLYYSSEYVLVFPVKPER